VLRAALAPTALSITDDSHLHAGTPVSARANFSVRISSARFVVLGRVARHRLVWYFCACTGDAEGIHAVGHSSWPASTRDSWCLPD